MKAQIGADDLDGLLAPRPELLCLVTGIEPRSEGRDAFVGDHGVRSTQRIALADMGTTILVAFWPAEWKEHAQFLYAGGRAKRMIAAARDRGWRVDPAPQLAFFNSPHFQRLYMSPDVDAFEYARRWEQEDALRYGRFGNERLRAEVRPWLEERGYLDARDGDVFEAFARILGQRPVDVRPALRFKRRFEASADALKIRADINAVIGAAGELQLPLP